MFNRRKALIPEGTKIISEFGHDGTRYIIVVRKSDNGEQAKTVAAFITDKIKTYKWASDAVNTVCYSRYNMEVDEWLNELGQLVLIIHYPASKRRP